LELRRILFPKTAKSQSNQNLAGERPASLVGGTEKSFAAVVSNSGKMNGGGLDKGKTIILEGIPEVKEHSKQNTKLNPLTINMGKILSGQEKGDLAVVNLSINLELICGLNGEWSLGKTSIGKNSNTADI
jgi:hypothetical protein